MADEVIDSIGRQSIETIVNLSSEQITGPRTSGRNSDDIRWREWHKNSEKAATANP